MRRDPRLAPLRRQLVSQLLKAWSATIKARKERDRVWEVHLESTSPEAAHDTLVRFREVHSEWYRCYLEEHDIRHKLRVANGIFSFL